MRAGRAPLGSLPPRSLGPPAVSDKVRVPEACGRVASERLLERPSVGVRGWGDGVGAG